MTMLEIFLIGLLIVMVYVVFEANERSAKYKALAEEFADQNENQAMLIHTMEGQLKIRRRLLDAQNVRIKKLEAQLKEKQAGDELAERMVDDGEM